MRTKIVCSTILMFLVVAMSISSTFAYLYVSPYTNFTYPTNIRYSYWARGTNDYRIAIQTAAGRWNDSTNNIQFNYVTALPREFPIESDNYGNTGWVGLCQYYPSYFREIWLNDYYIGSNLPYCLAVTLHELGHMLGLAHVSNPASIMYPAAQSIYFPDQDSINGVNNKYS